MLIVNSDHLVRAGVCSTVRLLAGNIYRMLIYYRVGSEAEDYAANRASAWKFLKTRAQSCKNCTEFHMLARLSVIRLFYTLLLHDFSPT